MPNPPHPGEVLRELCIELMGLSIAEAAEALGVGKKTWLSILNGLADLHPTAFGDRLVSSLAANRVRAGD